MWNIAAINYVDGIKKLWRHLQRLANLPPSPVAAPAKTPMAERSSA
jgi:hypothetical protein